MIIFYISLRLCFITYYFLKKKIFQQKIFDIHLKDLTMLVQLTLQFSKMLMNL